MISIKITLVLLAVAALCSQAYSAPSPARDVNGNKKPGQSSQTGDSFDITNDDLNNALMNDNNILILPYDPIEPKQIDYKTNNNNNANNKLKSSSFTVLERESSSNVATQAKRPNLMLAASQGEDAERSGSPNVEKMKDIALNSREVRLVGPNQREVEMKDDLPTKVVVALENLQKEAKEVFGTVNEKLDKGWTEIKKSDVWTQVNDKLDKGWTDLKKSEVWGQVNEKLDKGWTDLKSMVEGVVAPSSASNNSG